MFSCALLSAPYCRQISTLLCLRSYVGALMSALLCRRSFVVRSFDGVPGNFIYKLTGIRVAVHFKDVSLR